METVSDQSAFSRKLREQDEGRFVSGNIVLWVAVIAVLIGLNFASWSFCMWVFGQPEHPMNYRLLTKLEKLDPIHGFTPVTAPTRISTIWSRKNWQNTRPSVRLWNKPCERWMRIVNF